jgi:hypothetical protein
MKNKLLIPTITAVTALIFFLASQQALDFSAIQHKVESAAPWFQVVEGTFILLKSKEDFFDKKK